jgi:hypothetical protein
MVIEHADRDGTRGAAVALQQPTDLALDRTAIQRFGALVDARLEAVQARVDARLEALVHRALLVHARGRAAQQERLFAVRTAADLHLDVVADLAPVVALLDLLQPALELRLRRADHVPTRGLVFGLALN